MQIDTKLSYIIDIRVSGLDLILLKSSSISETGMLRILCSKLMAETCNAAVIGA